MKLPHLTSLNAAVDRCLAVTTDLRHRFLLLAYARHRLLEVAGRYEELFTPDMMSPLAVYHMNGAGVSVVLDGQQQIRSLYRMWSQTNQTIFYAEDEEVAVTDHYVTSVARVAYQQVSGKSLRANKLLAKLPKFVARRLLDSALAEEKHHADDNDMYVQKLYGLQMIWRYDDQGLLLGEDVYEPLAHRAEYIKLDPSQVMKVATAAQLLGPLIKPLPVYAQTLMPDGRALASESGRALAIDV